MGAFQWSCYTNPWGPSTSHPLTVFSSMTAFQQPGEKEEEERRMMRLAERLKVRGQTALQCMGFRRYIAIWETEFQVAQEE